MREMLGGFAKGTNADTMFVEPFASIPKQRANPIDPLLMYSSSLTMVDMRARDNGYKLSNNQKKVLARRDQRYAGARAMLYSPLGHGSSS